MRAILALCAISLAPRVAQSQPAGGLEVRAYVSTAGPYGESWELKLSADGRVRLEILFMLNPMGRMSGEFLASPDRIAALRKVIVAERFAELPAKIWPGTAPLHQPDLRLTITNDDATHEVALYDPGQFDEDARVKRFMRVWNQVFELVPLRPKW